MAITKVEYYNGSTKIGERTSEPFDQFTWENAPVGNHSITAKLYEDGNLVDTSSAVSITVNEQSSGGGDFDPDYQDVLDAATANGDPLPDAAQQEADNQTMLGLKSSGAYGKLDTIFKAWGTADPEFKKYCWKRKIKMELISSATWNAAGELLLESGNALKTKLIPSTDAVNSTPTNASVAVVLTGDATLNKYQMGVRTTNSSIGMTLRATTGTARINGGAFAKANFTEVDDANLLVTANKTSYSTYTFKAGGVSETVQSTDTVEEAELPPEELYFGAEHQFSSGVGTVNDTEIVPIRFLAYGASLIDEHDALSAVVEP